MGTLLPDLRYAVRVLAKSPGFTALAVISLSLGIGANTAIFSLINATKLSSLPVPHAEQLFLMTRAFTETPPSLTQSGCGNGVSYPVFGAVHRQSDLFANVFGDAPLGFGKKQVAVRIDGESSFAEGDMVTGEYFSGLGVSPIAGRLLTNSDESGVTSQSMVIGYTYWERQFGRSGSAIGKQISINGVSFTIVGVMPRGLFGIEPGRTPDFWIPIGDQSGIGPWISGVSRPFSIRTPGWFWMELIVRLKPDVSPVQARRRLESVLQQGLAVDFGPSLKPVDFPSVDLQSLRNGIDRLEKRFANPLRIVSAIVGALLLIACANVAALLLSKASARQKEIAVRISVGASRGRLLRQLLTERVLLSSIGGLGGLILAHWGMQGLMFVLSQGRRHVNIDVQMDWIVLAFTMFVSMLTGILFGLAPAVRAMRVDISSVLKGVRAVRPRGGVLHRLDAGKAMVIVQVAASLAMVIVAGLLVRTVRNLTTRDLGFDPRNLILFRIEPMRNGFEGGRLVNLYDRMLESIRAVPGVASVSMSSLAMISGATNNGSITTESDETHTEPREFRAQWNGVGPDFFDTVGLGIVIGRGIAPRDMSVSSQAAVVNETWAREMLPGENPIGKRFHIGSRTDEGKDYEIVGVARDALFATLRETSLPTAYLPYVRLTAEMSLSSNAWAANPGAMYFEVRPSGDAKGMMRAVGGAVEKFSPDALLLNLTTEQDQIAESIASERTLAQLTGGFSLIALLLGCVGLYGILTYAVIRRTHEFGIRMALGAQRRQIIWIVVRDSLLIIAGGTAVGLALAGAGTKLIGGTLYGVTQTDPWAIGLSIGILTLIGIGAGLICAWRTVNTDVMIAVRSQ